MCLRASSSSRRRSSVDKGLDLRYDLGHDRAHDLGTLSWIRITRYRRPNTVWYFAEKLTRPEIVGHVLERLHHLGKHAALGGAVARLIAVTRPSMADGPVMKPPVPAFTCFASLLMAGFGSSPKQRGERHEPVVRHLRVFGSQ